MKRLVPYFIGALAGALLLAAFTLGQVSATTGCFPDTNSHWAETFICWLKDRGITSGYPDGTYKPNNNVTRAEMAIFLNKTASLVRATGTQFATPSSSDPAFVAPGASGDFATVTITAPGSGALLINGSLDLYCAGGSSQPLCGTDTYGNVYVNVDGTLYDPQFFNVENDGNDNDWGWNSSNSAYVPVAGGSHTVSLTVYNSTNSTGNIYVWSGGINVLFVAFDGTGASPEPPPAPLNPADPGAAERQHP